MNKEQLERMQLGQGFIAALDQSGGSTPKALKSYGIDESAYSNNEEMFDVVHEMRTRIIKSPEFKAEGILGAILFENTMDRKIDGKYTADYLWEEKHIVPFLKVDQGLADEEDGVQLMKPIKGLDDLLKRAKLRHVFGTKMRSVINSANEVGIRKIVKQQFEFARIILSYGLIPILEPEVTISISDKKEAETILLAAIHEELKTIKDTDHIMFKLSIPTVDDLYADLMKAPKVLRIVALSGGYSRDEANEKLARNHGLIASFSRALVEGLTFQQTDDVFNKHLENAIKAIKTASIA
ncbi:class I fructose-bisphosphate aldolase [Erysipelothrix larvae]|uniref:fructose-bisphosphate aldolase n=1 Tax=Erysipelothrix larvae TaxID=1514105 RepID=A0A0X8GZT1_9FIRM|nr:fructose bisphosphate aldolase [Erysipelothrix larvae]AMC93379.1 class I fructose-bisphosphate aldolase [Erysipelothrix larvae]